MPGLMGQSYGLGASPVRVTPLVSETSSDVMEYDGN